MRLLLAGLLLSISSIARADDVVRMHQDDCAAARKAGKTCILDIIPEDVDGKVPTHTEINVSVLQTGTHSSLIHIRHDFITEILKTAEDL
jgi:hypothetical protein